MKRQGFRAGGTAAREFREVKCRNVEAIFLVYRTTSFVLQTPGLDASTGKQRPICSIARLAFEQKPQKPTSPFAEASLQSRAHASYDM